MEHFNRNNFTFQLKRSPDNWCRFYLGNSISSSGKDVDLYEIDNSLANDYIKKIVMALRKNVNEEKSLSRTIYKIVLITKLGDMYIFNSINELKAHMIEFFKNHPNCIEFDYDYKL